MTYTDLPQTGVRTSRRAFLGGAAASAATLVAAPAVAAADPLNWSSVTTAPTGLATSWVRTLYDVVMAEGLTPPAAARFYHYTSLAMYEAALPEQPRYRSLAGQLHGLDRFGPPRGRTDSSIAVSEAVAAVALGALPNATAGSVERIVAHKAAVAGDAVGVSADVLQRSQRFGASVGQQLLAWIASDGYAEACALPYTPPVGAGLWRSTPPNFGTAIEPHWAMIRPAILRHADEVVPTEPIAFSTEPGSAFHDQAMVTYRQFSANTEDQIAIARFWTDNPRLSGLPAGHWFLLLADLADNDLALDLGSALEGFVRLGVALHDSFLNCWTWKYRYNLIRPVTYVRDNIDPAWNTLVNTPQFPEYTSGHSVASGAAEVVLTSMYGSFAFTDNTGAPRGLIARPFTSFADAANEAATSRLYGGIHYPMGIENGLSQGREIGRLVDARLQTRRGRHR